MLPNEKRHTNMERKGNQSRASVKQLKITSDTPGEAFPRRRETDVNRCWAPPNYSNLGAQNSMHVGPSAHHIFRVIYSLLSRPDVLSQIAFPRTHVAVVFTLFPFCVYGRVEY